MPTSRDITITLNGMRLSLSVRLTVSLAISIVLVASACADKASSGIAGGQPCAAVAKYCGDAMFALKLAQNCPVTCGKCAGKSHTTCDSRWG